MLHITSPRMELVAGQHRQALGHIETLPNTVCPINMFSSLTGTKIDDNNQLSTEYWVSNMIRPVLFSDALKSSLRYKDSTSKRRRKKAYVEHLIEIGPHSALKGPIKQLLCHETLGYAPSDVTYHSFIERGKNACETALIVEGRLFQYGLPIVVNETINGLAGQEREGFLVDVPPFGWNHNLKYWVEPLYGAAYRFRKHNRKDLFGAETRDQIPEEPRFRNILRSNEVPWT